MFTYVNMVSVCRFMHVFANEMQCQVETGNGYSTSTVLAARATGWHYIRHRQLQLQQQLPALSLAKCSVGCICIKYLHNSFLLTTSLNLQQTMSVNKRFVHNAHTRTH